jgi:hypothetical protein
MALEEEARRGRVRMAAACRQAEGPGDELPRLRGRAVDGRTSVERVKQRVGVADLLAQPAGRAR